MSKHLALLVIAIAASACHKASTPLPASNDITPTGGTVSMSDGTSVAIPAGAVTQNTSITVAPESDAVSIGGVTLVGDTYRFGPEGTQFATPVTVTIAYDPSKLPAGTATSDVTIMTAPVGSTDFVALATTSVDSTHVSAPTSHFSDFVAVVRSNPAVDLAAATIVDLSMPSTSIDLATSTPPDLSSTDLAGTCAPLHVTMQGCQVTGACAYYSMNCAQSMCFCQTANMGGMNVAKPAPYTNTLTCPPIDVLGQMWTQLCGFPQ